MCGGDDSYLNDALAFFVQRRLVVIVIRSARPLSTTRVASVGGVEEEPTSLAAFVGCAVSSPWESTTNGA